MRIQTSSRGRPNSALRSCHAIHSRVRELLKSQRNYQQNELTDCVEDRQVLFDGLLIEALHQNSFALCVRVAIDQIDREIVFVRFAENLGPMRRHRVLSLHFGGVVEMRDALRVSEHDRLVEQQMRLEKP
jgi:hypothetical protein